MEEAILAAFNRPPSGVPLLAAGAVLAKALVRGVVIAGLLPSLREFREEEESGAGNVTGEREILGAASFGVKGAL